MLPQQISLLSCTSKSSIKGYATVTLWHPLMINLTPEQIALILGGVVTLVVAFAVGIERYVTAKFKALAAKTLGDSESDTMKSRAAALKEMQEVDGIKFVFKIAEQNMSTAQRLLEVERELLDEKKRAHEQDLRYEEVSKELIQMRQENARLQQKIIELETENAMLRGLSNGNSK